MMLCLVFSEFQLKYDTMRDYNVCFKNTTASLVHIET